MKVLKVDESLQHRFAQDIPGLVWATGPVSYEYHFGDRGLFNAAVRRSWVSPGTLFAADATHVAVDEHGDLAGIEIGMAGNEFQQRKAALGPVWEQLISEGEIDPDDIPGLLERSEYASWLNPVIQADTYYIHAISVKPRYRGKRVGYQLIDNAINRARDLGFKKFQLDVLSDNPAVSFYHGVGLDLLAETRAPEPEKFGVPPEYRMGMLLSESVR